MEHKKTSKTNLENKKNVFFQIGLLITLFAVLTAFEWRNYEKDDNSMFSKIEIILPDEEIEITKQEEIIKQPPPPQIPDIEIVEDDVEVDDDLIFDEIDEQTGIDDYFVEVDVVEEVYVEPEIFRVVEEEPSFPGGNEALFKYLENNTIYPAISKVSGIQGTVHVTYVVEPDGSISNVKILKGIGGGCDEEALRVVKNMPKWEPGKQRGKPVRVQFNLPIRFILQ